MSRLITVAATIDGVDDESLPWESDEYGHGEFVRETVLSNSQPQNVMHMVLRWGGECRVELNMTGQQLDSGDVRVNGEALLFEGTSEDSGDLDGKKVFDFLVPRKKSIMNVQEVRNEDEGGDRATIRMTVSNHLFEED
jgi:hypothetical protein